jgi:hypothetical protein
VKSQVFTPIKKKVTPESDERVEERVRNENFKDMELFLKK